MTNQVLTKIGFSWRYLQNIWWRIYSSQENIILCMVSDHEKSNTATWTDWPKQNSQQNSSNKIWTWHKIVLQHKIFIHMAWYLFAVITFFVGFGKQAIKCFYFLYCFSYIGSQGIYPRWHRALAGGHYTITRHNLTHYRHYRDTSQPTVHVFGLGRKPEYPEETLHRNQTPNPINQNNEHGHEVMILALTVFVLSLCCYV